MVEQEEFSREKVKQKLNFIQRLIEEEASKKVIKSQVCLYALEHDLLEADFFDTEESLLNYIEKNQQMLEEGLCVYISRIDFIGDFEGRKDVIRVIDDVGINYCVGLDEENRAIYDVGRSRRELKPVWVHQYGGLRATFQAFKKKGIVLSDDFYARNDELLKSLLDGMDSSTSSLKKQKVKTI